MPILSSTMEKSPEENTPELAKAILRNWHFVAMVLALLVSGIASYSHLVSMVDELKQKQAVSDQQANALSSDFQSINPQLAGINAKLEILLKHNGL